MAVLINIIMIIIFQYICVSNHHAVHLKLTQYVSYVSIKLEKKLIFIRSTGKE